jgi:hypothetical protein
MIKSNKKINSAIEKLISRKVVEMEISGIKLNTKKPIQEVSGPGITGKKLPTSPNKIKNPAIQIKRRSIGKHILFEE